jgi:alpha-beta hydrolase superfamily lysophospholipase
VTDQKSNSETVVRKSWEIRFADGSLPIRGDVRSLKGRTPTRAVIICHGFKGFRNWGFFPSLARALARRGYAAVTFDFTRNGVGDDGVDFSALERFADNTHSRNLDEVRLVIDAVRSGRLLPKPARKLALLGHSRGGGEAILSTAQDHRVDALVTWSAISSVDDRWGRRNVEIWRGGGTVFIANSRTGQQMPIGPGFWQDIVDNPERLDIVAHAARIDVPWLIVHGEDDETVPASDATTLFAAAGPSAELCMVEGASHTFGAKHPYDGPTPELQTAAQTTLSWLDEELS